MGIFNCRLSWRRILCRVRDNRNRFVVNCRVIFLFSARFSTHLFALVGFLNFTSAPLLLPPTACVPLVLFLPPYLTFFPSLCLAHPLAHSRLEDTIFARASVALSAVVRPDNERRCLRRRQRREKRARGEADCRSVAKRQSGWRDRGCQVRQIEEISVLYL